MSAEVNSKEYWDERFGTGDWEKKEGREQSLFFYQVALSLMPDWLKDDINKNSLSIIDLGCAEGEGVNLFGENFKNSSVCGSDISAAALERAKKYYSSYRFIERDINNIGESFDVVFSSNTLEHFENPEAIIKNILPWCKKYFIMLIPFRETDRIEEHFYTFDYKSFPEINGDFRLVYHKETDCTFMKDTQWPGEEMLVVYMKKDAADKMGFSLSELKNGNWDLISDAKEETLNAKKLLSKKEEELKKAEHENSLLKEKIEEDKNAIMQIQFEAAQHKQAELDSRETYVWRTGLRIEKILRKTGIAFIRSLLAISDYKRVGLLITLKKGINEAFHRTNAGKNPRLKLRLCKEKFLKYKIRRQELYPLSPKDFDVPCEKGLISIVLPVYNGGDMISEAIDSCLNQTEKNFELIIVNDGSTDNTKEIINHYKNIDERIKVIEQENKKLPTALSVGFAAAKGEYLTWISADNIMLPDALSVMKKELSEDKDTAMVYTNMRLIDKKGKIKRGHFWFEKPLLSGNVILPSDTDALNTYANNTIGASFMYKAKAAWVLEGYSRYKNTLEDYDYWMRINSLFKLKHSKDSKPLYLYRRHENSLTARDKELGITKNRYKLMVLDDFRRDFYMSQLIWVAETEDEENPYYKDFINAAKAADHLFMDFEKVKNMEFGSIASGVCYIYFGNNPNLEKVEYMHRHSGTVLVSESAENAGGFDFLITTNKEKAPNLEKLDGYRGWFYASSGKTIFSLADSMIKNNLLYSIEGMIENETDNEKKISIIICTYLRGEKLIDAIWSVLRQSFSKKEYEIIVVDNAPETSGIREDIKYFQEKYSQYEAFIRYIAVPQKGLSPARNAGMWNAKGEYLLFMDDDALCDYYVLEELYSAFKYHPSAGIIGGQVILDVPFPRPRVLLKGFESLWSQFKVSYNSYKEVTQQFEFPYGANYAARKKALWRAGGFRMCYGRVGNDFSGGEETALCFKMLQIGYTIGIQPQAKVLHRVDHDRFSKEHVKKTIRAGVLTSYRFYKDLHTEIGWTLKYVAKQIKITQGEIKKLTKKGVEPIEIYYKKCYLDVWEELYEIIKNEKNSHK